mgnify:CR=1 FL=1
MKNLLSIIKNTINQILFKLGYRISKINNTGELVKIYKYKNYDKYTETQISYNKKKIGHVWADEKTLEKISEFLLENISTSSVKGICHGSRNGFEQNFFNKKKTNFRLSAKIIPINLKIFKGEKPKVLKIKKRKG